MPNPIHQIRKDISNESYLDQLVIAVDEYTRIYAKYVVNSTTYPLTWSRKPRYTS